VTEINKYIYVAEMLHFINYFLFYNKLVFEEVLFSISNPFRQLLFA